MSRFKIKGEAVIPVIGTKKRPSSDEEQQSVLHIQRTVPALVQVAACGVDTNAEGIAAMAIATATLIAQAYPNSDDAAAAEEFARGNVADRIVNAYKMTIKSKGSPQAGVQ